MKINNQRTDLFLIGGLLMLAVAISEADHGGFAAQRAAIYFEKNMNSVADNKDIGKLNDLLLLNGCALFENSNENSYLQLKISGLIKKLNQCENKQKIKQLFDF